MDEDTQNALREAEEIFHVHHYPDALLIVKETVTDTPPTSMAHSPAMLLFVVLVALLLPLFSLTFQLYVLSHPLTATVTLSVKAQQVSLGRELTPIVLSQSQIGQTSGSVHQDAQAATGTLTLYNGLFTSQAVPSGTVFTGASGVQVVTDHDVSVPPGSPGTGYGFASVSAHAVNTGVSGNILAGDVAVTFVNGVLVKNLYPFHGGRDAREYKTVTKSDIATLAMHLQATLVTAASNAFTAQVRQGEILVSPACIPTLASNHSPGQAATSVQVSVRETCRASVIIPDRIKHLVAGKTTQAALSLLGNAAIHFDGFGDDTGLPKDTRFIHLVFLVQEGQ